MKSKQLLFIIVVSFLTMGCNSSIKQSQPVLSEDLKQPAPIIQPIKPQANMGDLFMKLNDVILKYNVVSFQLDKIIERVNIYETQQSGK